MSKPNAKGRYKDSCCFVPYCRSGYRSNLQRASLFRAPRDPERLAEWEESIARPDKKLTSSAVVCERHFEESDIERTFKIVVNGVVNEIPREAPLLKRDAVPTIFDDYPPSIRHQILRKKLMMGVGERQTACESNGGDGIGEACLDVGAESDSRDEVDFAGAVGDTESDGQDGDDLADETMVSSAESEDVECTGSADEGSTVCDDDQNSSSTLPSPERSVLHAFEGIQIPSTWSRVPCLAEGSLAYARCEMEPNNFSSLFIERMVVFGAVSADDGSATATVYLRGRESFKEVLGSRCEAEEFIKDIDVVSLCEGCGVRPTSAKFTTYRDMYFAERCLIIAGAKGESCGRCKRVQNLTQRQICKGKK